MLVFPSATVMKTMAFERRRFSAVVVHIFLCSFLSFLSAEVESDISCLKSIKDSLEDPYGSLHTWDFNDTSMGYICHHFDGIACYGNNVQASGIELRHMGLKGQFPQGIENCSLLEILDLSHNELSGYIPSHIFSMLPFLSELDLSYNNFSGKIPASIGNCTNLDILRLHNNDLSGCIPSRVFTMMPLLFGLDLSYNSFSGKIPASIGNCTNLDNLRLHNNDLSGCIPSRVFTMMPLLSELDLSYNKFSGEISAFIGNNTSLMTLRLNNNKLIGSIVSSIFIMLPSVFTVDLSYNKFSGEIPASIGNLTHLHILRLHNNELSGCIPSHIFSTLSYLYELDFSYNKFSGEIPASIGNLSNLNALRLNNNEFIGEIPPQLGKLTLLTEFSVANNLLWGPVPVFPSNVDVGKMESYLNNSGLCGGPLEPCDPFHQSFKEGLVAGYVLSATSFIAVYLWYFVPWIKLKKVRSMKFEQVGPYYSYIRRKRKKEQQKEENQIDKLHLDLPEQKFQSLLQLNWQEKRCQEITEVESLNSKMSFKELCDATDCCGAESSIGAGTIGITYKARLPNGCFVAVQRLYDSQLLNRQFQAEIMILERCKHRNIVPLLWFCEEEVERKERILVYQYMPNGRLSDFISMRNDDVVLSWPVRVRIALGIARGLFWLHHSFHIVHFSICSECILLDQKFEPKISNFSEAKFINQNIGNDLDKSFYIDNRSNNEFGFEKMDVFDFGTVLLELLSGKRFNPRTGSFVGNDGSVVVTGTTSLSRSPSGFHEAIDKFLIGKGFDDEIFTLLTIACYCIQPFLDQRPTMLEVYTKMSNIWERHELGEDFDMSKKSEAASATTGIDDIVEIESM